MTEKPITTQELEELFGNVDLEQLIRDEVLKEGAEEIQRQYDKHLMTTLYGSSFADMVMIEPGVYKSMKFNRKMNFLEKLEAGRYWFWECLLEWIWCMTHPEDTGGDFFCHICSDYVKYEEDIYYL